MKEITTAHNLMKMGVPVLLVGETDITNYIADQIISELNTPVINLSPTSNDPVEELLETIEKETSQTRDDRLTSLYNAKKLLAGRSGVLVVRNAEKVGYTKIGANANYFFQGLRSWYDDGRQRRDIPHLIMTSTIRPVLLSDGLYGSPFNIAQPIMIK